MFTSGHAWFFWIITLSDIIVVAANAHPPLHTVGRFWFRTVVR